MNKELKEITLNEAIQETASNPEWRKNPWFKAFMKAMKKETSSKFTGQVDNDGDSITATKEVYAQVLEGYETAGTLDWVTQYTTDKASFFLPILLTGSAVNLTTGSGLFSDVASTIQYRNVPLTTEIGKQVYGTRSFFEDTSFDAMATLLQDAGKQIKSKQIVDCLALIQGIATGSAASSTPVFNTSAGFSDISTAAPTWAEICNLLASANSGKTGKPTSVLVDDAVYYKLLALDQFVSSLYATEDVMRTGVVNTTLGTTFYPINNLTGSSVNQKDTMIAMNDKTIGLVTRRPLTIEPYERPETNSYGFIASVRATPFVIISGSCARGFDAE